MDKVLDFIKRRFSQNNAWTTGNCYYFALILHTRFPNSVIYYDVRDGHFFTRINNDFYDWTGIIIPDLDYSIPWDKFDKYDPIQKERIIRDCIL